MPKLHEMIAVVEGKKSDSREALTELHRMTSKHEFFTGHERTYEPKDSDGETLPPDRKIVQHKVPAILGDAVKLWGDLWKAVATQDVGNTLAQGVVSIDDGPVLASGVPVTHLLYMEKQLDDVEKFVSSLVVLDPAQEWTLDGNADLYRTAQTQQNRTAKQIYPVVLAPATDKHPAQVKEASRDVTIGVYTLTNFSGAVPAKVKREMLERVRAVKDAVKRARTIANEQAVEQKDFGSEILKYVFNADKAATKRAQT
jgi:hypothetical protein